MNISWQLFRFPLDDERWQSKAIVGALLGLVAIIIWPLILLLSGFGVGVMRRTIKGEAPALPEWDDWGQLFGDGLRYWIIGLVYGLPAWIPMCFGVAVLMLAFLPIVAADQAQAPLFVGVGGTIAAYGLGFIMIAITSLLGMFLGFLSLVAQTRWVATGSLNSAFEFGEVWRLARAGLNNYLLAFAIWYGGVFFISMLASILIYTIVLACLYPFVFGIMMLYSNVIMGALFGMAYHHTQSDLPIEEGKAPPA